MKTLTRASMAFLLAASCFCFSGCGGEEKAAPSESATSGSSESGSSSSADSEKSMEKADGSGSK